MLTFTDIENNPQLLTYQISIPDAETIILRPLEHNDINSLAGFLDGLSAQTRSYFGLNSYDEAEAREMCDSISKYDKLRFIAEEESTNQVIALFQFSFDFPDRVIELFMKNNLSLYPQTDCRIGPCISDQYQNQGLGSRLFPYLKNIARQFEQKRMLLWGGVQAKNKRAISFYTKHGFRKLMEYKDNQDQSIIDMVLEL